MNLQQLYYFQKIAGLEHYTKAAEELNITQPCLSYSIAELEKELGAPLFYKKGRNIKLTSYGERFLTHVEKALEELEIGKKEIEEWVNPRRGKLTLAHISSMNAGYMPFLMRRFYENPDHKEIQFEFQENPTKKIIDQLKARKVDIGFGSLVEDEAMEFFPVYEEDMVLIVGKDHPLAGRTEITLKETEGYEYIAYEEHCGIRGCIDKIFVQAGASRRIVRELEDNAMITGMVSAGLGIAVVPRMYGDEYYNVKALEIKGVETRRKMYMMWLKNSYLSPIAGNFIQFVKELTTKQEYPVRKDGQLR
ncbi:LysR family transcriptional regulator [Cuneatibacter sp. NSJ-177]|uniref:LysR family transcriptional regulator n=1 Tax=Cuneatibacter sp. NSJ-177 TaxID=2931401 RepID=UPI001FD0EFE4|nr:LysR family transcriptional regulator [Cuneatibacter sp. NSJ-177]MCJ7836727.1 LysR family transcriptional regulator [Cuneatibacter sp. NSJ-177]